MSITYKTITRKNPRDLVAPEKYYAAVSPNGSVDFESLAVLMYSNRYRLYCCVKRS